MTEMPVLGFSPDTPRVSPADGSEAILDSRQDQSPTQATGQVRDDPRPRFLPDFARLNGSPGSENELQATKNRIF